MSKLTTEYTRHPEQVMAGLCGGWPMRFWDEYPQVRATSNKRAEARIEAMPSDLNTNLNARRGLLGLMEGRDQMKRIRYILVVYALLIAAVCVWVPWSFSGHVMGPPRHIGYGLVWSGPYNPSVWVEPLPKLPPITANKTQITLEQVVSHPDFAGLPSSEKLKLFRDFLYPEFAGLPQAEKRKLFSGIHPDFRGMSEVEQDKFIQMVMTPPPRQVATDPDFARLTPAGKRKVFSTFYPEFGSMTLAEQDRTIQMAMTPVQKPQSAISKEPRGGHTLAIPMEVAERATIDYGRIALEIVALSAMAGMAVILSNGRAESKVQK